MGDAGQLLNSYCEGMIWSMMTDDYPVLYQIGLEHKLKSGGAILVRAETMVNVQWIRSYEEGLEQARQMDKPMLLDFFRNG
jgi:hypothetical protein